MKIKPLTVFNVRPGRNTLLNRFRQPWAATLQMTALLCLLLQPMHPAQAIHVPDENAQPVWITLPGEGGDYAPGLDDVDQNGVADWMDIFNAAVSAGTVTYWSGGTWNISGTSTTFGGQWHAASWDSDGDGIPDVLDGYSMDASNNSYTDTTNPTSDGYYSSQTYYPPPSDSDNDGIPDDLDSYPYDATNNSFEWQGGVFTLNGIRHVFRSGTYEGLSADNNGNGVPESLEDWFTNPSAHGTIQSWAGGTFLISGEWCTFDPVNYYAESVVDTDSDGIPDEIDAWPADAWNNTSFDWQGGDFYLYGSLAHFDAQTYGGLWSDTDSDSIPDAADPLPQDADNGNTPTYTSPVFVWPAPGSSVYCTINDQEVEFASTEYSGDWSDTDGDSIPDAADPHPVDANNGNTSPPESVPTFTWPNAGEEFMSVIDGQTVWFYSAEYEGSYSDSDGDGIPDAADPYPSDAANNVTGITTDTIYTWPEPGTTHSALIQDSMVDFQSTDYTGYYSDSDGDGIPDQADPFPTDSGNGNTDPGPSSGPTFIWPESGTSIATRINDQEWSFSSSEYSGEYADADSDGIPDQAGKCPCDR